MTSVRALLRQLLESSGSQEHAMDVDEKDGFGPIRTTTRQNTSPDMISEDGTRSMQRLMQICIGFLACGPYLQSSFGKAARDLELTQLILKSVDDPNKFKVACPILFRFVRQKIFHSSVKTLHRCLRDFGDILRQYSYSKQQSVIIAFLDFLHSALCVWKADDDLAKAAHSDLREFYAWLSGLLVKGTCRSWALRDAIARFFGRYLEEDPTQETWTGDSEDTDQRVYPPLAFLPRLNNDRDIRVRFRAAIINAGLFSISHHFGQQHSSSTKL
jgi:ataxia telangiectasia mutated family protein